MNKFNILRKVQFPVPYNYKAKKYNKIQYNTIYLSKI